MGFTDLFSASRQTPVSVVFSIGSATITAALIRYERGDLPHIIYSTREEFGFSRRTGAEQLTKSMIAALMTSAMRVQHEGRSVAEDVLNSRVSFDAFSCFLVPPWFVSRTRILCIEKQRPQIVTRRLVEQAIDDELKHAHEAAPDDAEILLGNAKVLDSDLLRTRLNGYPTSSPYDKKARSVELAVQLSFISSFLHEKISEVLDKVFHTDDVRLHSSLRANLGIIGELFSGGQEALILEMTGEVTDVTLLRDNIPLTTALFPMGSNHLLSLAMRGTNMTDEEARSRIRMYTRGAANNDKGESARIKRAIEHASATWLRNLLEALEKVALHGPLPRRVYLLGEQGFEVWCAKKLQQGSFTSLTYSDQPFTVIPLDKKTLSKHAIFERAVPFNTYTVIHATMARAESGD